MSASQPDGRSSPIAGQLREACIDWTGEQIVDASTPRYEISCGEIRAAADLIDEMLAALKGSLGALEQDYDTGCEYADADWEGIAFQRLEAARVAIAKAEGR